MQPNLVSRVATLVGGRPEAAPPGWVRPAPDARARRGDVRLGLLLVAGAVFSVLISRSAGMDLKTRPAVPEELAWAVAISVPHAVRRRWPQAVLVVVAVAFIGLQARGVPEYFISQISLFLALYTSGAWGRERLLSRWTRGVVVTVMFAWLIFALSTFAWDRYVTEHPSDGPLPAVVANAMLSIVVNLVYFGAAWIFGEVAWSAAGQRDLLQQRNTELAVERDRNARRAVLDERVRIARELHDVVAHHVSVMGVQAGAARVVLDADPQAARSALAGIEQSARHAVGEMRRLLGVLRADPETGTGERPDAGVPAGPAPGLERIEELVAGTARAGLGVAFTVVGDPVPVPAAVSVSVYRIVQEALTNTVRHAGAGRVDVRLRYLPGVSAVEAEVVDDGRSSVDGQATGPGVGPAVGPAAAGRRGRGLGLIGMRERAALHDGELEVGPRPGGGFRVRVRFPLNGAGVGP